MYRPKVSARACADLLHAKDVDGVLSMGSTGAAVAAATLYCRRLPGVKRMMDEFSLESTLGEGTRVTTRKWI